MRYVNWIKHDGYKLRKKQQLVCFCLLLINAVSKWKVLFAFLADLFSWFDLCSACLNAGFYKVSIALKSSLCLLPTSRHSHIDFTLTFFLLKKLIFIEKLLVLCEME